MKKEQQFGSILEACIYPLLVVGVMWLVQWGQEIFSTYYWYKYGVLPHSFEGLKGIFFMPWIHSKNDLHHIINNSFPTFVLMASIIYFYKDIAWKILLFIWLLTGVVLWAFAANKGSYHIGMSGVVYGMAGFLFTSGVLRKYMPLQAISLFVVFVYGNLVWGLLPLKEHVSWEGHLSGLVAGVMLAFIFRKDAVQRPKFQYEIEEEMGIEPPDLEGMWLEKMQKQKELEEQQRQEQGISIQYHYKSKEKTTPSDDDTASK